MTRASHSSLAGALLILALEATGSAQGFHTLMTVDGAAKNDLFGISVDGVGDLNGDGRPDFVVGAYEANAVTGEAKVFSGATGVILYTFAGDGPGDRFGCAVAGAGDVNADGTPDVIVGAHRDDDNGLDCGMARIFSGRDGSVLRTLFGKAAGDEFGTAVAGAGDCDGDGYDDVIISAPCEDANGVDSGSAYVFSGRTGGQLHKFSGDSAHDWCGYAVNGASDVNQDGFDDVIIGACYDDVGGNNTGSAFVYSGRTGGLLHSFSGLAPNDWLGVSVDHVGDIDGDSYPDLVVGASTSDEGGLNAGSVRIYSGRTGALLRLLTGQLPGDEFGVSVRGCGDVDRDGRPDMVVGAYRGGSGNPLGGSAYVFSGATGANLVTCHGASADDRFGVAVGSVGDVNGDGYDDVIAGAVYADRNGQNSGSASILTSVTLSLVADRTTLSVADGGTQTLQIDAGPKHAGQNYWVLGSASGTSPGTMLGKFLLPLNQDGYFQWTIDNPNTALLSDSLAQLDASGRATATFNLPPNSSPGLVGITLHHAYVVFDNKVRMVSNAMPLTFVQ